VGNMRSLGSIYMDKGKLRSFLKNPLQKKAAKLLNLSRNQLRIFTGLVT
jgi:hypothetical protein